MPDCDAFVLRLAKAVEGPRLPVPSGSKFSLEKLREVRWGFLSRQEQREPQSAVKSVLRELVGSTSSIDMLLAARYVEEIGGSHYREVCQMLENLSNFIEQENTK